MATKANYFASQNGVEVYIVTTEQGQNAGCYPLDEKIKLIDLGVDYNRSKSYFSGENLRKAFLHFKKQRKLFKELQPDVIISPNYNFDHYWLPFIFSRAKVIKERHSSRFFEAKQRNKTSLKTKLLFWFNDYIDGLYDRIIVLNEDEKTYVNSGNAFVIPNPVEHTNLYADLSKKQVLAAGRISPVKAFDQLIEAWALIQLDFPDWQLHIYGQDYLGTQEKLEQLVAKHDLHSVLKFKGSVNNLLETMTDYSIYAMTSDTECFPMVLLEALSVGMPVVSYDSPNGPRNILIDGEDSFLTPSKNIPIFAEKLKILMENANLRCEMGGKGMKNVERFSLEKVMQQWKDLFQSLR